MILLTILSIYYLDNFLLTFENRICNLINHCFKLFLSDQKMEDFFRNMKKQFTPHEWNTIMSAETQYQQLHRFYRYWVSQQQQFQLALIFVRLDIPGAPDYYPSFSMAAMEIQHFKDLIPARSSIQLTWVNSGKYKYLVTGH